MEFIVSSSDLLSQLNTIKGVINSKNTLQILNCFIFTLDGNTLKIEASDLETTLETSLVLENVSPSLRSREQKHRYNSFPTCRGFAPLWDN